jgi:hypothetical protein
VTSEVGCECVCVWYVCHALYASNFYIASISSLASLVSGGDVAQALTGGGQAQSLRVSD